MKVIGAEQLVGDRWMNIQCKEECEEATEILSEMQSRTARDGVGVVLEVFQEGSKPNRPSSKMLPSGIPGLDIPPHWP